jgi:antitoxin ParD1/3/4
MTNSQRLSVELTPELIAVVQEAVDTGDYISSSDVVRDALRAWKLSRSVQSADTAELTRLWQEGLDSGAPIDARPVLDRLKVKYAQAIPTK